MVSAAKICFSHPRQLPNAFPSYYQHFWLQKCLGDKAPKFMLGLIRLTMFQNSYTLAQLGFYLFFVGDNFSATCFAMVLVCHCVLLLLLLLMLFLFLYGLDRFIGNK